LRDCDTILLSRERSGRLEAVGDKLVGDTVEGIDIDSPVLRDSDGLPSSMERLLVARLGAVGVMGVLEGFDMDGPVLRDSDGLSSSMESLAGLEAVGAMGVVEGFELEAPVLQDSEGLSRSLERLAGLEAVGDKLDMGAVEEIDIGGLEGRKWNGEAGEGENPKNDVGAVIESPPLP
jgi:hypothetical protein